VAIAFAEHGGRVLAVDIDDAKIAALLQRAAALPSGRIRVERIDLLQPDLVRSRMTALATDGDGIDIVINNAAIYPSKAFEAYTLEEWDAVHRVNVISAVANVQAALPGMRRKAWGRIINVSSITFFGGWANLAPYVTSKGSLVALTRAWAREFGADGITANCIAPGAFPTDAEKIHPDPEGYTRFVLDHQSIKRRGAPRDIAEAMLFLASDRAGFITGQTLSVDGGWVMQ
jgi:NAD(P)-dependent dehydrogenase (short-subunit alcohol dehydrogenase family)